MLAEEGGEALRRGVCVVGVVPQDEDVEGVDGPPEGGLGHQAARLGEAVQQGCFVGSRVGCRFRKQRGGESGGKRSSSAHTTPPAPCLTIR